MATAASAMQGQEAIVAEYDTLVIGGGQAGLAAGYYLKKLGRSFAILDANERIGGSWRTRTWDSLRLHPGALRRASGLAVPRACLGLPDGARDG